MAYKTYRSRARKKAGAPSTQSSRRHTKKRNTVISDVPSAQSFDYFQGLIGTKVDAGEPPLVFKGDKITITTIAPTIMEDGRNILANVSHRLVYYMY
jgi:hypothetical protein